jgi:hypothetical protein
MSCPARNPRANFRAVRDYLQKAAQEMPTKIEL